MASTSRPVTPPEERSDGDRRCDGNGNRARRVDPALRRRSLFRGSTDELMEPRGKMPEPVSLHDPATWRRAPFSDGP